MRRVWMAVAWVWAVAVSSWGLTEVRVTLDDMLKAELGGLLDTFLHAWDNDDIPTSRTPPNSALLTIDTPTIDEVRANVGRRLATEAEESVALAGSPDAVRARYYLLAEKFPVGGHIHRSEREGTLGTALKHEMGPRETPEEHQRTHRAAPPNLYLRKPGARRCMGSGGASVFSGGNALNYMSFLVTLSTLILNVNNNINNNNDNNNNNNNNNLDNSNVNTNLNANNANQINIMPPAGRRRRSAGLMTSSPNITTSPQRFMTSSPQCLPSLSVEALTAVKVLEEALTKGPAAWLNAAATTTTTST